MSEKKRAQINFRCDAEFLKRLKLAAEAEGKHISKLIREAVLQRIVWAEKTGGRR